AALRAAMTALDAGGGHEPVVALVRRDNAQSLAAFVRAGFVARGERRVGDTGVAVLGWPVARVLLAADGGPAIGLGHLGRVLALARGRSHPGRLRRPRRLALAASRRNRSLAGRRHGGARLAPPRHALPAGPGLRAPAPGVRAAARAQDARARRDRGAHPGWRR